jgi:hypothetical protein
MFDTVAISRSFGRSPNIDLLIKNDCKPFHSKYNGEPYKLVLNDDKDAKEPRLTISKSPQGYWIIRAEVSIGAWMFNSNLFLPNEKDMKEFFPMLTDFVRFKTDIKFDARLERITRVDITRDFYVGEGKDVNIIKELNFLEIPRYNRRSFNNTGISFENKGKEKNKKFLVYSKHQDFIDKNATETEIELAKGILRLEVQHKNNRAVTNLSKSFKFPNHNANLILTRDVSDKVIETAMTLICLEPLLQNTDCKLERLATNFDKSMPLTLAGHLLYKAKYGVDYGKLPFINLSPATIKKYERECAKTGILSL